MDILKAVFQCFGPLSLNPSTSYPSRFPSEKVIGYMSITENMPPTLGSHEKLTTQQTALLITSALRDAQRSGDKLNDTIDDIVREAGGWRESIAEAVLHAVENVLKDGLEMNEVMKVAYYRALEMAKRIGQFAHEHPLFCTLVAVGVIAILAPYVLEVLGFGELGIVEGSWAARWQATYKGYVKKDSLFAYLQSLGMRLKWRLRIKAENFVAN